MLLVILFFPTGAMRFPSCNYTAPVHCTVAIHCTAVILGMKKQAGRRQRIKALHVDTQVFIKAAMPEDIQ